MTAVLQACFHFGTETARTLVGDLAPNLVSCVTPTYQFVVFDRLSSQGLLLREQVLTQPTIRLRQMEGLNLKFFTCLANWIENVVIRPEEVARIRIAMG